MITIRKAEQPYITETRGGEDIITGNRYLVIVADQEVVCELGEFGFRGPRDLEFYVRTAEERIYGVKGTETAVVFVNTSHIRGNKDRQELKAKFWSWIEPTSERYSDQLEALLDTLTDEQLTDFIEARTEE